MPSVQHHARHPARDRLPVQQCLDRRLAHAVLAIRGTRLVLGDRHPRGRAMYPDGAAVHQQRPGRPEGIDQLLRRRRSETEHVDDGVGTQLGDPVAEPPGRVLSLPIDRDPPDRPPFRRRPVRLAFAPAHCHDFVSGSHQAGDEVGTDVPGGSDDKDATHLASLARRHLTLCAHGMPPGVVSIALKVGGRAACVCPEAARRRDAMPASAGGDFRDLAKESV